MESKKEMIARWRQDNPYGRKCDILRDRDLEVSRTTLYKYWDECSPGTSPLSALDKVMRWRKANPDGTKSECMLATGLSRRSVFLRWSEAEPKSTDTLQEGVLLSGQGKAMKEGKDEPRTNLGVEDNGQLFFIL